MASTGRVTIWDGGTWGQFVLLDGKTMANSSGPNGFLEIGGHLFAMDAAMEIHGGLRGHFTCQSYDGSVHRLDFYTKTEKFNLTRLTPEFLLKRAQELEDVNEALAAMTPEERAKELGITVEEARLGFEDKV